MSCEIKIHIRIIHQASGKYFLKLEESGDTLKVAVCNGRNVWESTKLQFKDLVSLKPDGIEDSVQSAIIRYALFDEASGLLLHKEIKKEDIILDFTETGSGHLNVSWKIKQSLGITISLGTVILLKVLETDAPGRIVDLLEMSVSKSNLQNDLTESLELNKKLLEEYEKTVKAKIELEDELYTKFRLLLNKVKKTGGDSK